MADDGVLVTIVPHLTGDLTVCLEDCVRIHLQEIKDGRQPELNPPPELDIPELLVAEPEGDLVVLEDDRSRRERPIVVAVVGKRVDMRQMSDRIEQAREAGETVEVHVYPDLEEARRMFGAAALRG
jgi:hypothetical protein